MIKKPFPDIIELRKELHFKIILNYEKQRTGYCEDFTNNIISQNTFSGTQQEMSTLFIHVLCPYLSMALSDALSDAVGH